MSKNTNIYTYKDNTNTFNVVTDINEWLKAKFILLLFNYIIDKSLLCQYVFSIFYKNSKICINKSNYIKN